MTHHRAAITTLLCTACAFACGCATTTTENPDRVTVAPPAETEAVENDNAAQTGAVAQVDAADEERNERRVITAAPILPMPAAKAAEPELESFTQALDGSTVEFEMRPIKGGTVSVKNEAGETVEVDVKPFYMATTECPWELYDIFVFRFDEPDGPLPETEAITRPSRPYVSPDRGYGHNGYASISISFKGADHFCKWLSAKTGRTYRLPTEAEWALACAQSGITTDNADQFGWFEENADGVPHEVASKDADANGLHDLWGNTREWAVTVDDTPIALGGSFMDALDDCGCGARIFKTDAWQETDPQFPKSPWWLSDAPFMGFRIVCEVEQDAP